MMMMMMMMSRIRQREKKCLLCKVWCVLCKLVWCTFGFF